MHRGVVGLTCDRFTSPFSDADKLRKYDTNEKFRKRRDAKHGEGMAVAFGFACVFRYEQAESIYTCCRTGKLC